MEPCDGTERILNLCVDAIEEIRVEMPTGDRWVRRWASLLALLRTTCEVLKKEAPHYWRLCMKQPNAGVKGRDPEKNWTPDIYSKFICTNTNLFLHEGLIPEARSIMPHGSNMQKRVLGVTDSLSLNQQLPPPRFSYFMNSEPYVGRLALEVATEAVNWLKCQIEIAEK
jgi:hypothetical protein